MLLLLLLVEENVLMGSINEPNFHFYEHNCELLGHVVKVPLLYLLWCIWGLLFVLSLNILINGELFSNKLDFLTSDVAIDVLLTAGWAVKVPLKNESLPEHITDDCRLGENTSV